MRDFVHTLNQIRKEGDATLRQVTVGIHKLMRRDKGELYDEQFLNSWMDDFLLSRNGSNLLLDQCRAIARPQHGGMGKPSGVIDIRCDALTVTRKAVAMATQICQTTTGKRPVVHIDAYVDGTDGPQVDTPCYFPYVPSYLLYILNELLKNAFHATVKKANNYEELKRRPIRILLCRDEHRVAIRISDQAGGIPFDVGDKIWSYFYGAAAMQNPGAAATKATALAGYGVGLPLARLRAVYLGGRLAVTTYPGYGTDAHVLLPSVAEEQMEEMPMGYAREPDKGSTTPKI
eukprot:TRINITY_DN38437_c0_g1_i1.p1 TRINITY_DN38437_c0_g1~~TRINITY_DN38437_c0_g1_i1.p1  ORF type:complete len:289 (+),score=61.24 TRINITY_DN38437_c0_g1_i1:112-978(+)